MAEIGQVVVGSLGVGCRHDLSTLIEGIGSGYILTPTWDPGPFQDAYDNETAPVQHMNMYSVPIQRKDPPPLGTDCCRLCVLGPQEKDMDGPSGTPHLYIHYHPSQAAVAVQLMSGQSTWQSHDTKTVVQTLSLGTNRTLAESVPGLTRGRASTVRLRGNSARIFMILRVGRRLPTVATALLPSDSVLNTETPYLRLGDPPQPHSLTWCPAFVI